MPPSRPRPTMLYIGANASGSSIHRLFPVWAGMLGLEAELAAVDLPLDAGPNAVRRVVEDMARDRRVRGAFVRAHEIHIFRHAYHLFAELDRYARHLGEVDTIICREGGLIGLARDPLTIGRALDRLIPPGHWMRHGDAQALLLGAGGAARALAVALIERPRAERPTAILVADLDDDRLLDFGEHLEALDDSRLARFLHVDGPEDNDRLMATLPRGSLVVNATGLGKDAPGSPITDAGRFPEAGIAFELNYRGELAFLAQVRRQEASRALRVGDGWHAFLFAWGQAIADVFELDMGDERLRELEEAAAPLREAASEF